MNKITFTIEATENVAVSFWRIAIVTYVTGTIDVEQLKAATAIIRRTHSNIIPPGFN